MRSYQLISKTWLPARTIVEEMVNSRFDIEPSGAIAILPQACPWKGHLFDIEEEKGIQNQIQYVLFGDKNDW